MKNLTFYIVFLFVASGTSFANDVKSLTLAIENSWPPYADERGMGFSREIVSKAFKLMGVETKFKVYPYARVLDSVKKGRVVAGLNVTKQSSTLKDYHFSELPILKAKASFYFSRGNKNSKINQIEDLPKGIRIGLITGYEYGDKYEKLRSKFVETRVKSQEQILNMLIKGRIDCAILFDEVAIYTMKKYDIDESRILKTFENHTSDIYVAFNKENPISKKIGRLLDEGLTKLKESGEYQRIFTINRIPQNYAYISAK